MGKQKQTVENTKKGLVVTEEIALSKLLAWHNEYQNYRKDNKKSYSLISKARLNEYKSARLNKTKLDSITQSVQVIMDTMSDISNWDYEDRHPNISDVHPSEVSKGQTKKEVAKEQQRIDDLADSVAKLTEIVTQLANKNTTRKEVK